VLEDVRNGLVSLEAAEMLGITVQELERQGLKAFLEKELRAVQVELLAICQKYGVSSWEGMHELIVEDTVEEGKILDDFQRVDHLTAKARRIQDLLGRVGWQTLESWSPSQGASLPTSS
jgi:hypothetical protein